jgi:mannose-1-phosphate guanylyltransferase
MSRWAALLAGGSGTRFWPLSTAVKPKQMLALAGDVPLLVQAANRLAGLVRPERTLVVTAASLVDETSRLLPTLPRENILGEPKPASTAPALTWATRVASDRDSAATVLSLHADWFVGDDILFRETASRALDVAERHDMLVTVGIQPTRPDTGYGYIQPGPPLDDDATTVDKFLEKPDAQLAADLIGSGALWNSGLFAWTAQRFFAETAAVAPEIAPHLPLLDRNDVAGFFTAVTAVAVDVSHFERSRRIACVAGRFPWDDVGTWAALKRVRTADAAGNVLVGRTFARQSRDCVVWGGAGAIVVDGVHDIVVVQANGITLVTTLDRSGELKALLADLPDNIRKPQQ